MSKVKENKRPARRADQALYQYYRPMGFDQVIGQEATVQTLKLAISKKSVGHAILFSGPRGTGKTTVARILAHQLNGVNYQVESTDSNSQYQFDIIEIDAASNRRIEEIRQLLQNITIAPAKLEYKVYIIDEFHMLSTDSFNALLKTLEEPPEKVIFILATTEIHKVPATIISRCQRFNFRLIPTKRMVVYLQSICQQEQQEISEEALNVIAIASGGSPRDSLSILSQLLLLNPDGKLQAKTVRDLIGWAPEQAVVSLLDKIKDRDLAETVNLLRQFYEQGIDASILANQLMIALRDQIKDLKDPVEVGQQIDWLESLLEVKLSQQPEITLEAVLIKQVVIDANQAPATKPTPKLEPKVEDSTAQPKPAAKSNEKQPEESKEDQSKSQLTTESDDSQSQARPDGDWGQILEFIKKTDKVFYNKLQSTTASLTKPDQWLVEFRPGQDFHLKMTFNSDKASGKRGVAKLKQLINQAGFECSSLEFKINDELPPKTESVQAKEGQRAYDAVFNKEEG